jgi:hypothetical protein
MKEDVTATSGEDTEVPSRSSQTLPSVPPKKKTKQLMAPNDKVEVASAVTKNKKPKRRFARATAPGAISALELPPLV